MTQLHNVETDELFGIPTVLTAEEAEELKTSLIDVWRLTYGQDPGSLERDLQSCRRFFDPIARGQSLRERLAQLPVTPARLHRRLSKLGAPVVLDVGDETLIVGVEGRILIELLKQRELDDPVVMGSRDAAAAEHAALSIYRQWNSIRLQQVIDLRSGRGSEVMQAVAVGVALAVLVNRSDSVERAIVQPRELSDDDNDVNLAIYAGAERFAVLIGKSRGTRSTSEQRLRGGYGFTEARRRLAHRMVADRDSSGQMMIYIPANFREDVVRYLGHDLSRRSNLDEKLLGLAFDELVLRFQEGVGRLARKSMAFDRPADTRKLRYDLLAEFSSARRFQQSQNHD